MTNIKKIGLSALAGALAMTSANAASLSISGETEISYTKGGDRSTTSNPLGQANTITFEASGELDNGVSVSYKRTTTDAFAADDSELVFGNILGGTLAMQSTGSPLDGIDNKTPTAHNDAEGMVGSIADVSGANGDGQKSPSLAQVFEQPVVVILQRCRMRVVGGLYRHCVLRRRVCSQCNAALLLLQYNHSDGPYRQCACHCVLHRRVCSQCNAPLL